MTKTVAQELLDGAPSVLTVPLLAELLGYSTRTVYRWIESGEIQAIQLSPAGGRYRITRREVVRFLEVRLGPR